MAVLIYAFLALIGIDWPELRYGASVADLFFVPLAIAVVARRAPAWRWDRADLAIVIYLLGSLPAIAISTDRRGSVIEFGRELYVAAIFVVTVMAVRQGYAATIARGLALGGALLSAAGLLFIAVQFGGGTPWPPMGEVMQLPYLGGTLRLRALTASEAMLACVLTASLPFAIVQCSDRPRWRAAAAVMVAAAAFTFSHAIAGLAVAVLLSAWPAFAAWPRLRRLAVAGVVLIVLALNFAATVSIRSVTADGSSYSDATQYHYAVDQREMAIGNVSVVYNVMSYFRIKQVAWQAFVEHPIAGVGLDQFHGETRRAFDEGRLTEPYREIDPHSTLPGRFAETGIIGGATLLFLWMVWSQMAVAAARRGPIGLAAAAAFAGLIVISVNADIMNFRFLWVIAGLMRGLDASSQERHRDTETPSSCL